MEVTGMNIFPLYPQQVMQMWPLLQSFVAAALVHTQGEMGPLDVCERAMNGAMQLWVIAEQDKLHGVAVTEVIEFPQITSLRIVTLSGERFAEWKGELDQRLEQFAHVVGAGRIEAVGRPGWARSLRALNYKPTYVIVTRLVGLKQEANQEAIHEQVGRNN
jgi:hypothetical protein